MAASISKMFLPCPLDFISDHILAFNASSYESGIARLKYCLLHRPWNQSFFPFLSNSLINFFYFLEQLQIVFVPQIFYLSN
uniref:Uncharacterized protein n=1 Tax=Arundo donax TaxID=35708 RepID=A0A0A9H9K7_ARUDO